MIKPKYYLVERTLLPEVFQRVIEANEAIASGKAATASEAAKIAGLSRSAYYKYKDGVRPFFEATTDRIVTYHFMLHDQPGVLSSILGLMARSCKPADGEPVHSDERNGIGHHFGPHR